MNLRIELEAALGASYEIESELGGGGMSHLFIARDRSLDRRVVVKVVAAEAAAFRSIERFRREVGLAASLQHPHIVSVLAAGEVAGLPYFIMPFVDGRSLRKRLEQEGALPVREAVAILRDVARACAYAHERGVVHRDIKPDNVLIAGGSAMITDFGVAKALSSLTATPAPDGAAAAPLTHEGITLGTPGYMAPEQVAGDATVDHRADIYAFGIMAYELLTGQTPFHGRTPHQLLAAHLSEQPAGILTHRPELPRGLAALVMRCLEKNPEDRPQTAAEIAEALDDPSILSGSFSPTLRLSHSPTRRRRRTGMLVAGAVAAVIAVTWVVKESLVAEPSQRSVAVLPLVNLGGDSATAYFADGLTDEITLAVGRLPGVTVSARGAAAAWRGRTAVPREVGRELGVSAYLEGSVQVSGERLRLIAQLTDARTGLSLWSQRFSTDLEDVFAVQDSIAGAIAEALRTRFGAVAGGTPGGPAGPRGAAGTGDVQAYDLFLRGRFLFQRRTPAALREAITLLDSAVKRDPGFARAYAGLADVYTVLPLYTTRDADSARTQALLYVERAIALDSTLSDAIAARGTLYIAMWRWSDAHTDLRRAIALDSTNANAWQSLGEWLILNGQVGAAESAFAKAAGIEPTAPVPAALLALTHGIAGRTSEALTAVQRAEAMDTSLFMPRLMHGVVLLYGRRPTEAIPILEGARRLGGNVPNIAGSLGYAFAAAGQRARAEALRDSILEQATVGGATAAIARINLGLGDTAQALTMLEWALGAHDPVFASEPLISPIYDSIRRSPRFRAIVERVGLDAARLTR